MWELHSYILDYICTRQLCHYNLSSSIFPASIWCSKSYLGSCHFLYFTFTSFDSIIQTHLHVLFTWKQQINTWSPPKYDYQCDNRTTPHLKRDWVWDALVHIMAWCLFGTRPFSEPMLAYVPLSTMCTTKYNLPLSTMFTGTNFILS